MTWETLGGAGNGRAALLRVSVEHDVKLVHRGGDVDFAVPHLDDDLADDDAVRIRDVEPDRRTRERLLLGCCCGLDKLRRVAADRLHAPIRSSIVVASNPGRSFSR